eukprot:CAMPEP_0119189084 /NCGR_PEP_ID=MMETSP1316-20130426/479_1 /TAXON_ID=41880 /ORGANISM="Pycnococcus provasolii, Strain RCC2336" /LENGTH=54 /DNA_ID=CAMNT_0007183625 /DNA_START=219 /DNA_END=380 /DNA_ORIENTATION=+
MTSPTSTSPPSGDVPKKSLNFLDVDVDVDVDVDNDNDNEVKTRRGLLKKRLRHA